MRLLVKNIGTIVGIETAGRLRLCGGEMDRLETFDDAWLLADDGRIAAFGSMDSLGEMAADEVVDAGGGIDVYKRQFVPPPVFLHRVTRRSLFLPAGISGSVPASPAEKPRKLLFQNPEWLFSLRFFRISPGFSLSLKV